jgi:hypothetical protein
MGVTYKNHEDSAMHFRNKADAKDVLVLGGPKTSDGSLATFRGISSATLTLQNVDTAGGVFAWANPYNQTILIRDITVHTTTVATSACTLDCGPAANGTTLNDTLIDGLDVNAAVGVFDSIEDGGTNGRRQRDVLATEWVTGSVASGASAGLVGTVQIDFVLV